jgi:methyl-accepting chemotaxis protein
MSADGARSGARSGAWPLGIALVASAALAWAVSARGFRPGEVLGGWLLSLVAVAFAARWRVGDGVDGEVLERVADTIRRGDWRGVEDLAAADSTLPTAVRDALRALSLAVREACGAAADASAAAREVARLALVASEHGTQLTAAMEPARVGAAQGAEGVRRAGETVAQVAGAAGAAHAGARETLDSTARVAGDARGGIEHAEEAARSTADVAALVRDLQDRLRALHEATGTVGEITNVVSGIGRQTHLLALNASIEAARAGIHGKGFAVVAEEVGKLAAQSAGSIRRIEELVKQITERTGGATEQARRMARSSGRGEQAAQATLERVRGVGELAQRAHAQAESAVESIARVHAASGPLGEATSSALRAAEGSLAAAAQAASAAERHRSAAAQLREAGEKLGRAVTVLDAAAARLGGTGGAA